MKFRPLSTPAALVLISILAAPAMAAPYSAGDILMGFVATDGASASETLIVNLGAGSSFRDRFDSSTPLPDFKNIGTRLASQFGEFWYDSPTLRVNIYGATGADAIGDTLVSQDPFQTIYVSRGRAAAATSIPLTSQNVTGISAMTGACLKINATTNAFGQPGVTVDAAGVAVMPDSLANTIDEFTRPAVNSAFDVFGSGIDQSFATGNRGTLAGTEAEAVLDLYRIQGRNDVAGQYHEGGTLRQGVYKGTFTLSKTGSISYHITGTSTPPVTSGFATWAVSKGLPANLPVTDDRDQDNIPALVEYALDLNPLAFNSLPTPVAGVDGLLFSYTKGTAASADTKISYQIEASSQLSSGWAALPPVTNTTAEISALLPAADPSGRNFARLRITQAP